MVVCIKRNFERAVAAPPFGHGFEEYDRMSATTRANLADQDLLVNAYDALAFGLIVCDANGRVVHANAAAASIARNIGGISLGGKQRVVSAHQPNETRALATLICNTARGGAGSLMRLSGRDGHPALLAFVMPLPKNLSERHKSGHALIALRPTRDVPTFTEATLADLFDLSSTQAAIGIALFKGATVEEIASGRGIKISTVRSHLAEIFARTGAQTQRDLLRLLGNLPPLR